MDAIIQGVYFLTAVLVIVGLKRLSSPVTARSGNLYAAAGMTITVVAVIVYLVFSRESSPVRHLDFALMGAGIIIGGGVGVIAGRKVQMTAMPQLVALFNGMGGGAAALIALLEFRKLPAGGGTATAGFLLLLLGGVLIGAVSFSGSMVAFGKLQRLIKERPVVYPFQQVVNLFIFVGILFLGALVVFFHTKSALFSLFFILALLFGVIIVLPIGGADMPVVIALLNACTGLAVATDGFTLGNNALIISGTLVGASGTLLTKLMCKAMNRSLNNVLFKAFGTIKTGGKDAAGEKRTARDISLEDAAVLLAYAQNVVIVPGYGMAVAKAQQAVHDLSELLGKKGVTVKFGIHPVAGRMPGHMNVLLAEAQVPYTQLFDLDDINPEFERTDVVLVIGANDVVNPAAKTSPGSPIYGMPVLDVEKAKTVIVIKRSLNPGFAGIDNDLFYSEKTRMLFGDAREVVNNLIKSIKESG